VERTCAIASAKERSSASKAASRSDPIIRMPNGPVSERIGTYTPLPRRRSQNDHGRSDSRASKYLRSCSTAPAAESSIADHFECAGSSLLLPTEASAFSPHAARTRNSWPRSPTRSMIAATSQPPARSTRAASGEHLLEVGAAQGELAQARDDLLALARAARACARRACAR
jgi:hypothetical protein